MIKLTKKQVESMSAAHWRLTVETLNKRLLQGNVISNIDESWKPGLYEIYMQTGWEMYDYGDSVEFVKRYESARMPDPASVEEAVNAAE